MTLRLSSFGVRGFVGQSLTPRVAMDVACAFGTFLDGRPVLVGRDTRHSSPMVHTSVVAGLAACGCRVLDCGICPAPVLQYLTPRLGAAGGISVSGGHHGMGWNSLTLIGTDGAVLEAAAGETVMDLYHGTQFRRVDHATVGPLEPVDPFASDYFAALQRQVDAARIRAAGLTVLIDPVGGAACAWLQPFADTFGVRLVGINAQPSGYLAREPEPRPRAATQMAAIIGPVKGDAGFVLSSDAGRMSLVTEAGEPVSEEMTFPLIAGHILRKASGPVVTNCCTTRTLDDVAARHGAPVIRTPVGQGYVAAALADEGGRIGGEGSGAVALPSFGPAFDGFLMMALVLDAMAADGRTLSALLAGLPRYHIVKKRIPCESRQLHRVIEQLRDVLGDEVKGRVDTTDGIRVDWDDGWVHVRASRTEQLIRVISEDRDRAVAQERAERIARRIEQRIL